MPIEFPMEKQRSMEKFIPSTKIKNETHTLHGGTDGSAARNWKVIDYDKSKVKLVDELPDGHMGFPGNLTVETTYKVNKTTIDIFIEASTDKTTLCNLPIAVTSI